MIHFYDKISTCKKKQPTKNPVHNLEKFYADQTMSNILKFCLLPYNNLPIVKFPFTRKFCDTISSEGTCIHDLIRVSAGNSWISKKKKCSK